MTEETKILSTESTDAQPNQNDRLPRIDVKTFRELGEKLTSFYNPADPPKMIGEVFISSRTHNMMRDNREAMEKLSTHCRKHEHCPAEFHFLLE